MRHFWTTSLLLFSLVLIDRAAGGDWPRFRGPDGSAITDDDKVPTEWSDKKNLKWKLALPGRGMSSPIVVGNRVFVTCYSGGDGDLSNLKRYLLCADRDKGTQLWSKTVPAVLPEFRSRGTFGYHGYASSTPVSDGERIYVHFGTTGVLAFDLDGNKVWQQSVGTGTNAMFGSASSPIIWKDLIIVLAGAESGSIRAFDRKTGKVVWNESAESVSSSYSTPSIVKNKDGADELLVMVVNEVWGINPANGKLKWYATARIDTGACTSLVSADGIAYAVGGRQGGRTAIRVGGKDDVTRSNVLWSKSGGTYVSSPVLHKGHLYWLSQQGVAICADAKTGEEVERKRIGGSYYASPVLVKDRLYIVSRYDGTHVLEATPKMTEVAHNKLGDGGDFSGSPAVSNGQLFLRSDKFLYCIGKK